MSEWFHIGQKVVCCIGPDHHWPELHPTERGPVDGGIYTIRAMEIAAEDGSGDLFLLFDEIRNPPTKYATGWAEPSFDAVGFRPLRKRTTSIEVFKQLLVNPPKEIERV